MLFSTILLPIDQQGLPQRAWVVRHQFRILPFVLSIDLIKAVICQRDFLDKFQKHRFYTWIFKQEDRSDFEDLVQNYVSFMKLAEKSDYGQNIDRKNLEKSQFLSSCALVFVPLVIPAGEGYSSCGATCGGGIAGGCGATDGGCGGGC